MSKQRVSSEIKSGSTYAAVHLAEQQIRRGFVNEPPQRVLLNLNFYQYITLCYFYCYYLAVTSITRLELMDPALKGGNSPQPS